MFTYTAFILFTKIFFENNVFLADRVGNNWFSVCIIDGIGAQCIYLINILVSSKAEVAWSVQSFYAWRIYALSGKKLPGAVIMIVSTRAITRDRKINHALGCYCLICVCLCSGSEYQDKGQNKRHVSTGGISKSSRKRPSKYFRMDPSISAA